MAPTPSPERAHSAESSTRAAPPSRVGLRDLPDWARVEPARQAHVRRVVALLEEWADELSLPDAERSRWLTAGWLHDAVKDAPTAELRAMVPPAVKRLPTKLLHGHAAAERARRDGITDTDLLDAVRWHTTGHPSLGRLGRALYLADYLEPGRTFDPAATRLLRARMPGDMTGVLRDVLDARIAHLEAQGTPVRPETRRFLEALDG